MRPVKIILDPANFDADGISVAQQPAASGVQSLTMTGALAALGTPGVFDVGDSDSSGIKGRIITITSAGNDAARTFTITGTDPEGAAQTEAVTGENADVAESAKYFQTITGITTDDDTAGNVSVGTVNTSNSLCTAILPLNYRCSYPATIIVVDTVGTYVADIEQCFDALAAQTSQDVTFFEIVGTVASDTVISWDPADTTPPKRYATGIRLRMDSYTNGASLSLIVLQN